MTSPASITKDQLIAKLSSLEEANNSLRDAILNQISREATIADLFSRAYLALKDSGTNQELCAEMEKFLAVH